MTAEPVRIHARDGSAFEAWLPAPTAGRGAGLIVLAEIYNANQWARSVADRYAAEGPVVHTMEFFGQHLGGKAP